MTSVTALVSGVAVLITALVGYGGHRLAVQTQRSRERAEVTVAQQSLATTASALATAAYQLADRLQQDIDRLRQQQALERLAAEDEIIGLRRRLAIMQEEINALRDRR